MVILNTIEVDIPQKGNGDHDDDNSVDDDNDHADRDNDDHGDDQNADLRWYQRWKQVSLDLLGRTLAQTR